MNNDNNRTTSIYHQVMISYLMIILIMILPTIFAIYMWQYNRNQYDNIIRNTSHANSLLKIAKEDIPNELWDIVSGRKSVKTGQQQIYLSILEDGIIEIMSRTKNDDNNQKIDVAFRTYQTLKRNILFFEQQVQLGSDVTQNEVTLDEIRSIGNLFAQIMQDYIISEVESANETNNSLKNSSFFLLAIQFAILLAVGFLAITNYRALSKRIRKPISKMEEFSSNLALGNLQAHIDSPKIKEFNHLIENLNTMAKKIDLLIQENIEEQKNLQKEEMSKLQAQITPHFLYNTFDSIIWLAESGKTEEVVRITSAFSNFLRISLSRGHDWITISQEIEHVKNYLTIQKVRYAEILNYELEVNEELNNFMILKSTLQPLIENAIYHGIKNKRGRGHIKVTADFSDETKKKMKISVIDDGAGFTPERLEQVKEEMNRKSGENLASVYGLYNVNKRLILYYNDRTCGLKIQSEKMKGATISFTIPCLIDVEK